MWVGIIAWIFAQRGDFAYLMILSFLSFHFLFFPPPFFRMGQRFTKSVNRTGYNFQLISDKKMFSNKTTVFTRRRTKQTPHFPFAELIPGC